MKKASVILPRGRLRALQGVLPCRVQASVSENDRRSFLSPCVPLCRDCSCRECGRSAVQNFVSTIFLRSHERSMARSAQTIHAYIYTSVSNVRLETRFKIQEPDVEICQVSTLNLCILNFVPTDVWSQFCLFISACHSWLH